MSTAVAEKKLTWNDVAGDPGMTTITGRITVLGGGLEIGQTHTDIDRELIPGVSLRTALAAQIDDGLFAVDAVVIDGETIALN